MELRDCDCPTAAAGVCSLPKDVTVALWASLSFPTDVYINAQQTNKQGKDQAFTRQL